MAEQNVGGETIGRRGKSIEELRRQRSETRQSQTYKAFLDGLCKKSGWDQPFAEKAAVTVLGLLERRIQQGEAEDLEAQLPRKLVTLIQSGEAHEDLTPRELDRDKFVQVVASELGKDPGEAEVAIRNVFGCLREKVSEGEVDQVIHQLPKDLQAFWQASA